MNGFRFRFFGLIHRPDIRLPFFSAIESMHPYGPDPQSRSGKKSQFPQISQDTGRAWGFWCWIDPPSTKDSISYSSTFSFAWASSQKCFVLHIFQRMGSKVVHFLFDCFSSSQAFPSIPSGMSLASVVQRYRHEFGRWDKGLIFVLGESFSLHIDGPYQLGR